MRQNKKFISLEEISKKSGYSLFYLKSLVVKQNIKTKKIRGSIYVEKAWLNEFLNNYTFEAFLRKESQKDANKNQFKVIQGDISLYSAQDNFTKLNQALHKIKEVNDYLDEKLTEKWHTEFFSHDSQFKQSITAEREAEEKRKLIALKAKLSQDFLLPPLHPANSKPQSIIVFKKAPLPVKIAKFSLVAVSAFLLFMMASQVYNLFLKYDLAFNDSSLNKSQLIRSLKVPKKRELANYILLYKDKLRASNTPKVIPVYPQDLFGRVAGVQEKALEQDNSQKDWLKMLKKYAREWFKKQQ